MAGAGRRSAGQAGATRLPRLTRAILATLILTGCAHIEPPPGGPPDFTAPLLLSTRPDSMMVEADFDGEVEFQFDETVSEGSSPNFGLGTGDLERLILLSPVRERDEVPHVRWRRSRITVKPRDGWRPGTTYRIELMAGVNDLRNNRSRQPAVVTFTTGGEAPGTIFHGSIINWTTSRPVPQALVEAMLLPDSLIYRSLADSVGDFTLGPLPGGTWLVRGVVDENRNRRFDRRELFDTVRTETATGAGQVEDLGELWVFRHDSLGPILQTATMRDTLSILLTFSQLLAPEQEIPLDSVLVQQVSDSAVLAVEAILSPGRYDSLYRRPATPAPADSAAAADTTGPVPLRAPQPRPPSPLDPRTSRPRLDDKLVLRLTTPLRQGERYIVDIGAVRNANGAPGRGRAVLAMPAAAPADTTGARPDSLATRPDSGGTRR